MHRTITPERVMDACERRMNSLVNPGFCPACGEAAEGCEPDARNYACDFCGGLKVFGAEEILMMSAEWRTDQ